MKAKTFSRIQNDTRQKGLNELEPLLLDFGEFQLLSSVLFIKHLQTDKDCSAPQQPSFSVQ